MANEKRQWKPRGATKGQLAHRAGLVLQPTEIGVGLYSRTLDAAHKLGASPDLCRTLGNDLIEIIARAEP